MLTDKEKEILGYLAIAWNAWIKLPELYSDDVNEMKQAIHAAQQLIALRVARRVDRDVWKTD